MRYKGLAFVFLALFLFGVPSGAQESGAKESEKTESEAQEPEAQASEAQEPEKQDMKYEDWDNLLFEDVLLRSCEDPTLKSAIALPQPKLILETSEEGDTKVKARIGVRLPKRLVLDLEATSPRDSSGETTLASLDGLSKGSTAKLALSWFIIRKKKYDMAICEVIRNMDPNPHEALGKDPAGNQQDDHPCIQQWDYKDAKEKSLADDLRSLDSAKEHRLKRHLDTVMMGPSVTAVLEPEQYKALAEYWQSKMGSIPVLTVEGNAEEKEFEFVNVPTMALRKESHTDYNLTASAGAYFWGAYGSLNYRMGNEFKSGRTADLCTPLGSSGLLECKNRVVAPPTKGTAEEFELEIRRLFGSFGVAGHLTRDLQANVTTVEVPVYFLQSVGGSKMELNGGVSFKWQSDTDDYSLSVFIGPALSTVLRMFSPGGGRSPPPAFRDRR